MAVIMLMHIAKENMVIILQRGDRAHGGKLPSAHANMVDIFVAALTLFAQAQ